MTDRSHTLVVGLGNPVLSDDAAGLKVAEAFRGLLTQRPLPGINVACSTRGGFELLDLLSGYGRAVIVDALTLPEPIPGRVHRLDPDKLSGMARLIGSHDISLSQALLLAEQLAIPMPTEIIIFGIEAGEIHEFSEDLTPPVSRVIEPLALRIHDLLAGLEPPLQGITGKDRVLLPGTFRVPPKPRCNPCGSPS